MAAPKRQQHFLVLDGLRSVAAIAVVLYHATFIFGGKMLLPEAYLARRAIRLWPAIANGCRLTFILERKYAPNRRTQGRSALC